MEVLALLPPEGQQVWEQISAAIHDFLVDEGLPYEAI